MEEESRGDETSLHQLSSDNTPAIENDNSETDLLPSTTIAPSGTSTSGANFHNHTQANGRFRSVRIQRDYNGGDTIEFKLDDLPSALVEMVPEDAIISTIRGVNAIYAVADGVLRANIIDNWILFLSCHLSMCFHKPHFKKCMEELDRFIDSENVRVYQLHHARVLSPRRSGALFLEFQLPLQQADSVGTDNT